MGFLVGLNTVFHQQIDDFGTVIQGIAQIAGPEEVRTGGVRLTLSQLDDGANVAGVGIGAFDPERVVDIG